MKKVTNELDALDVCEEYHCLIQFRRAANGNPAHVVVRLNAWTVVAAETLIEAVNRLVEVYHTSPLNYKEKSWWEDSQKLLNK